MGCPPPQSPWPLSLYACLGLQLWIHFSRIPLSAFSFSWGKARVPSLFCCCWFFGFCFVKDLTNNCLPFLLSPHSTYPNRNYVFVHSWGFKDQLCTDDFHLSPADFSPELQIPIGNFLLHISVWMDFTNSNWRGTERLIPTTPLPLPTLPILPAPQKSSLPRLMAPSFSLGRKPCCYSWLLCLLHLLPNHQETHSALVLVEDTIIFCLNFCSGLLTGLLVTQHLF